jgi:hypothetical protein
MKPARWLVLPLLLLIAALIFMRQKGDSPRASANSPEAAEIHTPSLPETAPATDAVAPLTTPSTVSSLATAPAEPLPDELEYGHHLQVIVQDESRQPLEGAAVKTTFRADARQPYLTNLSRIFTTGAQGLTDVRWPTQQLIYMEVLVSKDDFSPRRMMWDLNAGDEVPPSFTVKLKGSIHVGGVVVDPEGNPVSEAIVSLSRFWRGSDEIKRQGEEATFPTQKHTTSADGRWTARNVPPELLERIHVRAEHTNFIGAQISADGKPEVEQELRAGTSKIQLLRGFAVRGRVVDEQQQPIPGAQVWSGRKYSRERKETKADAEGRFQFSNVNTGDVDFTATAEGYAPGFKKIPVSRSTEEIVLILGKGSTIRGRVENESKQPLEGVRVVLEGSSLESASDLYSFSTKTDSEGKFEWNSAPNKPMPFYFGLTGYEQRRDVSLKPGEDNVVTLRLSRKVQGQVVDAETQKPVTRFSIAPGTSHGPKQFYPDSYASKEFRNDQGLFTLELNEQNQNGIQASADGYAEEVQQLPAAENGEVKVIFRLKPSPALVGTVLGQNDQPVAGASVVLVDGQSGGRSVQFSKGRFQSHNSRTKVLTTDPNGRFEIASPPDEGTVLASDGTATGSASVAQLRGSGVIKLQGFGRIEGVILQGVVPGAGQEVLLSSPNSGVHFDFATTKQTANAEGRFTFENVPAGTVSIVRLIKMTSGSWRHSHRTDVVITPGQTTPVVLGGADGTLQGQVRWETPPTEKDIIITADASTYVPPPPNGLSAAERQAFYNSPERQELMKNSKHYSAVVGPDGSIQLDSVAPGEYTLRVSAQKSSDRFSGASLASGESPSRGHFDPSWRASFISRTIPATGSSFASCSNPPDTPSLTRPMVSKGFSSLAPSDPISCSSTSICRGSTATK